MNAYSFRQVKDKANRRIRGLWIRGSTFYVQTTITDPATGLKKLTKLPLPDAKTEAEAKEAMYVLLQRIAEGKGVSGKEGPEFGAYRQHYTSLNVKAAKTKDNEDHFLKQWEKFVKPETRITSIKPTTVMAYRTKCLESGLSPRTINLHVRALKQLMLLARTEQYLTVLPFDGVKQMREDHVEKEYYDEDQICAICTEALRNHPKTGEQFADFITLSMYSGGRLTETLNLKWSNVDWDNGQLVFPGDVTKNSKTRRVDFNRNLKNHLKCMEAKKEEGQMFLFPSIRTKEATTSFKKILNVIREDLGFETFTFHSTRHHFASVCVMKGIDFKTIADWLGHADGGILVGKTYGHLAAAHKKAQAAKL